MSIIKIMENINNNDFWKRVKLLIRLKNIKQETVCADTEISLGTMRGWITHSRLPDAAQAVRIAQALGTTAEYLITGMEDNPYIEENKNLKEKIQKAIEALQA